MNESGFIYEFCAIFMLSEKEECKKAPPGQGEAAEVEGLGVTPAFAGNSPPAPGRKQATAALRS
jgi:hypothetical protein